MLLQQKLKHSFQDCKACLSVNTDILSSHSSFPTENRELVKLCNNLTSTFLEKSPPCTKEMEKTVQNFVKILSPNLGVDIKVIIKGYEINTKKKCHGEKRKTKTLQAKKDMIKIVKNRIKRRRCPKFSRLR